MATTVTERTTTHRPVSTSRRDLIVSLATLWLAGGLFLDGWAHSHVPELETFFTPWHGVLYSGYAVLALTLVPAQLWRGRPGGPGRGWGSARDRPGPPGAVPFSGRGALRLA